MKTKVLALFLAAMFVPSLALAEAWKLEVGHRRGFWRVPRIQFYWHGYSQPVPQYYGGGYYGGPAPQYRWYRPPPRFYDRDDYEDYWDDYEDWQEELRDRQEEYRERQEEAWEDWQDRLEDWYDD